MTTVTALFDTYEEASRTLHDLQAAGIASADLSIISNRSDRSHDVNVEGDNKTASGAGTGAGIGTVLGGGAGLLAGLGIMAIPGIGPVVAAGWLVATAVGAVAGATAGGLIGALTGAGVSEEHAHVYAEGIRRGGTLVVARTDPSNVARVRGIMLSDRAVNIDVRRDSYRNDGWERVDHTGEPITTTDLGRRTDEPRVRL
jgi:hypothetical protein